MIKELGLLFTNSLERKPSHQDIAVSFVTLPVSLNNLIITCLHILASNSESISTGGQEQTKIQ